MIPSLNIVNFVRLFKVCLVFVCASILLFRGCSSEKKRYSVAIDDYTISSSQKTDISPVPEFHNEPELLSSLGERLFHDTSLSGDETVSCASCHNLDAGGDDGKKASIGIENRTGQLNAPTVFNASLNFRQFWDGRADSLESQAHGPIVNPVEMGGDWFVILPRLKEDAYYQKGFDALFDDGITPDNVVAAIASFERTLLTPNSPFDRYLKGEKNAMSQDAVDGFETFKALGCVSCHQGVNIGGNMYQHVGLMADYFRDRGDVKETDFGLYNVTKREKDRYKFKVPSLRNVADTSPYFHDGSVVDLEQAISVMAWYQLGVTLEKREIVTIKAFLQALSAKPIAKQKSLDVASKG